MTPDDALIVELAVLGPLQVLVPWWLARRDLASLPPASRARAWPEATLGSAALLLGPFALLAYFPLARRSLKGFGLGLCWTTAVILGLSALDWALSGVLPVDAPPPPAASRGPDRSE
ncbi:MAG TPA: hypothetical protein PLU22_14830 [Polyangiaceae bacterium]|mgnify:CR=1 FL=1|nr:hypothetical protein [Polyangiaceae bacterium]